MVFYRFVKENQGFYTFYHTKKEVANATSFCILFQNVAVAGVEGLAGFDPV